MKKLLISTGIAALMASNSMVSLASSLAVPNDFTSGTTAVAQDVNDNFTAVEASVNDNDSRVTTNTGNITANDTDIATNVTDIATNVTDIATNVTDIATNATDIADLQSGVASCPTDMVTEGSLCVDKYEASLWDAATGGNQLTATAPAPYYTCEANGSNCGTAGGAGVAIYARSVAGAPAQRVTWFQAVQACANVGKRLPTTAEWQMASAGTPEGTGDGSTGCNSNAGNTVGGTGDAPSCVSTAGAFDMVGNLWEWVAEISPAITGGYASADTTGDFTGMLFGEAFDNDTARTPDPRVVVIVDGSNVSIVDDGLLTTNSRNGFRCVR